MKWPGKYITHPWDMTEQLIWDASVGALAPEKQATQPVGWHSLLIHYFGATSDTLGGATRCVTYCPVWF